MSTESDSQSADYSAESESVRVPPALAGARLDKALATLVPARSRAAVKALIIGGGVSVDGAPCRTPRLAVAAGAEVTARFPPAVSDAPRPQAIALEIVHEDADLIVLNKAAGMVVHPAPGHRDGTLQNALLHHHPPAAALARGGVVHRLDKDTSGLLAVAKNEKARRDLIEQFKTRTIGREYLALVCGEPPQTGLIDKPLLAPRAARPRAAIAARGRDAQTGFERLRLWRIGARCFALLRCRLHTGRTHQIRAHLESAGHPLVGDPIYRRGAPPPIAALAEIRRQLLHAAALRLRHPAGGGAMQWQAPPPADFQAALQSLAEAARARPGADGV